MDKEGLWFQLSGETSKDVDHDWNQNGPGSAAFDSLQLVFVQLEDLRFAVAFSHGFDACELSE